MSINKHWPLMLADAEKTMTRTFILLLCFAAGYITRDHQAHQRTITLSDVRVLQKISPSVYRLQIPPGLPWVAKFCEDSPVDLDPGMKLTVLVYEDIGVYPGTCKSILNGGGFTVERDENTGKFISFNQ